MLHQGLSIDPHVFIPVFLRDGWNYLSFPGEKIKGSEKLRHQPRICSEVCILNLSLEVRMREDGVATIHQHHHLPNTSIQYRKKWHHFIVLKSLGPSFGPGLYLSSSSLVFIHQSNNLLLYLRQQEHLWRAQPLRVMHEDCSVRKSPAAFSVRSLCPRAHTLGKLVTSPLILVSVLLGCLHCHTCWSATVFVTIFAAGFVASLVQVQLV